MSETVEPLVEYACQDRVVTITLNRPSRLNAFNTASPASLAS